MFTSFGKRISTIVSSTFFTSRRLFNPTVVPSFAPTTVHNRHFASASSEYAKDHPHPHHYYSNKKATPVSLKAMLEHTGDKLTTHSLVRTGRWLHEELPIRLARQVKSIDRLPYGLCMMPSVRKIRKWYIESVKTLHTFPTSRTFEDELQFATLLRSLFNKHSKTLIAMAKGLHELKSELSTLGDFDVNSLDVTSFLDEFYMSRIGIRMLVGHHLALHEQLNKPIKDFIGLICTNTSPAQIIQDALYDAKFMCIRVNGAAPEIVIRGNTDLTFPTVPSRIIALSICGTKKITRTTGKSSSTSTTSENSRVA